MYVAGMRVIETPAATQRGPPVKVFARRRAKSEAHWRRMNNKWIKRYGYQQLPAMYTSRDSGILFVHPALMTPVRMAVHTEQHRDRMNRLFI